MTNKNPNKEEREKLAEQTNMTDKQLKVWFDYQRQNSKERNEKKLVRLITTTLFIL